MRRKRKNAHAYLISGTRSRSVATIDRNRGVPSPALRPTRTRQRATIETLSDRNPVDRTGQAERNRLEIPPRARVFTCICLGRTFGFARFFSILKIFLFACCFFVVVAAVSYSFTFFCSFCDFFFFSFYFDIHFQHMHCSFFAFNYKCLRSKRYFRFTLGSLPFILSLSSPNFAFNLLCTSWGVAARSRQLNNSMHTYTCCVVLRNFFPSIILWIYE